MPETSADPADGSGELSPRQREILSLLTAGKANKEIASQLGIGVGTVKQHVVALFRKLNVTNRAMAVSRGIELSGARPSASGLADAAAGVELRPCCVLSLACAGGGAVWQRLQDAAMAVLHTVDAVLVGRPGVGMEIIFGLHCVHEQDAVRALATVRDIHRRMARALAPEPPRVQAALVAGYLLASIDRCGGWTGESVAGRLIAHARSLRASAAPDCVAIDGPAQNLLLFARRAELPRVGRGVEARAPLMLKLASGAEPGHGRAPAVWPLVGRQAERTRLRERLAALASGRGGLVWLEGETGMGKTSLVRAVAAEPAAADLLWLECRCGAAGREPLTVLAGLAATPAEAAGLEAATAALRARLRRQPVVLVVDDVHEAGEEDNALLLHLAGLVAEAPLLLLGLGRRVWSPALRALPAERLRLGRMSEAEIKALIRAVPGAKVSLPVLAGIMALAGGVPLFAVELTGEARRIHREGGGEALTPPLTLSTVVLSRLDGLSLDRPLLKAVAWQGPLPAARLAGLLGRPAEVLEPEIGRAVEAGVVVREPAGAGAGDVVRISHSLVQAVLRHLMPDSHLPSWHAEE
jgi:DNA-binding CsgD family transcriptional regulator